MVTYLLISLEVTFILLEGGGLTKQATANPKVAIITREENKVLHKTATTHEL